MKLIPFPIFSALRTRLKKLNECRVVKLLQPKSLNVGFWFMSLIKLLNKNSVQKALKIQSFPHFGHCGTRLKILNKLIVVKLLQPKTLDVRLWFVRVLQLLIKNLVRKSLKVLPFPHFGHCGTRLKNLNELKLWNLYNL